MITLMALGADDVPGDARAGGGTCSADRWAPIRTSVNARAKKPSVT
jgi:hypothetical protein